MTDILLIEDDPAIREAIEYHLILAGFSVRSTDDGSKGLDLAFKSKPKLILLDMMLPEMDGFEFCQKLRAQNDQVAVLIITALDSEADKLKSFSLGADDYIVKPFSMIELLARIRAHLRRAKPDEFLSAEVIEFGDIKMDLTNHTLEIDGKPANLRPKEYQLLAFLASNPGILFTRPKLAEKVWGDRFVASSRTIDVHIRRIRNNLEPQSAYSFIRTVHTLGYKFELRKKEV